nr:unnamed protein product [Callosobruchus chinensis]
MANLGESLGELENICLENDIPELFIVKSETNIDFLNDLSVIRDILRRSKIKLSILKNVQVTKSKELRQIILNDFHLLPTSGHAGMNRMYNNIKKYYTWTGLKNDVNRFVQKCDLCQRCKHFNLNKEPLQITTTASSAFQNCELTKYVEAYALLHKDSETVAKAFVQNFILRYGIPQNIATDKRSEFLSHLFKDICKLLNITQLNSTAYHHESIGAWSSWVQYWCFAFNTTVHTETKYTPFELVFGKTCTLPSNLESQVDPCYNFDNYPNELKYRLQTACNDARNNLILSKQHRKEKVDQHRCSSYYSLGEKVLVHNSGSESKLEPIFKGPYIVLEDRDPNVILDVNGKQVEVHKNRIKPYYE